MQAAILESMKIQVLEGPAYLAYWVLVASLHQKDFLSAGSDNMFALFPLLMQTKMAVKTSFMQTIV